MQFSCGGGRALWVKISRGAPLEVQNGTQQDLNKMTDMVKFGGQKGCPDADNRRQTVAHTYWLSKRECPPPPPPGQFHYNRADICFIR